MEKIENGNYSNDYNTTQPTNQPRKCFQLDETQPLRNNHNPC